MLPIEQLLIQMVQLLSISCSGICQATGIPLDFYDQISIIIMTVIVTAAVVRACIMLIITPDTIGIGGAGVVIIGVDRILDMLRTNQCYG